MKEYTSEFIRNVAVAGHGKTGKTSLLEACLYVSGAVKRLGKVDDRRNQTQDDNRRFACRYRVERLQDQFH